MALCYIGAPKNLGFPFNISATTEASDLKIGKQMGFAKAHQKIPPRWVSGHGPGLWELPKILGSLIFLQRLTPSASNWPWPWGSPEEKVGVVLGKGNSPKFRGSTSIFTQCLKLATSNLVRSSSLPIINSHLEEKWAWPWARGASQDVGFPLNTSATDEASDFKFFI